MIPSSSFTQHLEGVGPLDLFETEIEGLKAMTKRRPYSTTQRDEEQRKFARLVGNGMTDDVRDDQHQTQVVPFIYPYRILCKMDI